MARYQLILAYDGTHFFGFQRQGLKRTVQLELETALRSLGWEGRAVLSAGRTDTGVHAVGQVVAFDLDWKHTEDDLLRAVNARLPADVAVRRVKIVDNHFHPRFDALSRRYRYQIYCSAVRDPLRDRYAWRIWPPVEVDILEAAASRLLGQHDFKAFGSPTKPGGSTVRLVMQANWVEKDDGLFFYITANAFLYRMVRRITFAQVLVAQGIVPLEKFDEAICQSQFFYPGLAEPQGLVLEEVSYSLTSKDEEI